ncbi:hypothetical protein CPB83DRAFT_762070 [Crepidotus variabilis]|uniref:Uncharacterized protein n=1 Tax=Crepidotus variabilis TaxID=179855 RepID=A0A9P6ELM9_9AGAR|nr:hypothetical protein CPB83DRAFT_762070 [Crepidotus variabilis]
MTTGGSRSKPNIGRQRPQRHQPNAEAGPSHGKQDELPSAIVRGVEKLSGTAAPFNDLGSWISDPYEKKIYTFNGERPGKQDIPTSDFYSLDITTRHWTDLTNGLAFKTIGSPFSPFTRRELRQLPLLSYPSCTLFRHHDTSFLLIFGGSRLNNETDEAMSDLIVVNLSLFEWWYQPIGGGNVKGRIKPAIAVIGTQFFIFGGYENFEGDGSPITSYSVANLLNDGTWKWDAARMDLEYPREVPAGMIFSEAIPVYDGLKLFLTPGRTTGDEKLSFTESNMFFYHTQRKTFRAVVVDADKPDVFPTEILWHWTSKPPSIPATTPPMNTHSSAQQNNILICAWVPWGNSDAVPELWRLSPSPEEHIVKLGLGRMVYNLNHDFQGVVMLGEQLFLLGYVADETKKVVYKNAKWNIIFEVPYRQLPGW